MKKYIIGQVTHRPGLREAFLDAARRHAEATRKEPGCLFFDITLGFEKPDTAHVAECFVSEEAHQAHNVTPHMVAFREAMARILLNGRFENIYSDTATVDEVSFA